MSQHLKIVKHLETILEVINRRTREHLSIANTCVGCLICLNSTVQGPGLSRCSCCTFGIATGPAPRWLRRLLKDTDHGSADRLSADAWLKEASVPARPVKGCVRCWSQGYTRRQWTEQWLWHLPTVSGEITCSVIRKSSLSTTMMVGRGCTNKYAVWINGMHKLSVISGKKVFKVHQFI